MTERSGLERVVSLFLGGSLLGRGPRARGRRSGGLGHAAGFGLAEDLGLLDNSGSGSRGLARLASVGLGLASGGLLRGRLLSGRLGRGLLGSSLLGGGGLGSRLLLRQ